MMTLTLNKLQIESTEFLTQNLKVKLDAEKKKCFPLYGRLTNALKTRRSEKLMAIHLRFILFK